MRPRAQSGHWYELRLYAQVTPSSWSRSRGPAWRYRLQICRIYAAAGHGRMLAILAAHGWRLFGQSPRESEMRGGARWHVVDVVVERVPRRRVLRRSRWTLPARTEPVRLADLRGAAILARLGLR